MIGRAAVKGEPLPVDHRTRSSGRKILAISIHRERIHQRHRLLCDCKILISWIAILPLVGCAYIPNYPPQLSPLTSADTTIEVCPNISGRYADKGLAISPDGQALGEVSLIKIFHEKYYDKFPYFKDADTVIVMAPEKDVIEIQSLQGEKHIATWKQAKYDDRRRKGNFSDEMGKTYGCISGFVRLARSYAFDATYGALYGASDFLYARKAVDGSLSIYHRAGWAVIVFLIPVWHMEHNEWYSFPPVEQNIQH